MGTVLQFSPAERKAFGNTPLQQPTETRQDRVHVEVDETEAHFKRRDKQLLLIPFHYAIEDPEEQLKNTYKFLPSLGKFSRNLAAGK